MTKQTLIVIIISIFIISCKRSSETYDNYVVLVSFDGCRWDYTQMYDTPNFAAMAASGVKAEKLIPAFPTKTFPNHYTIVTGLYPDHHGIINNSFYAPDLDKLYRIGDRSMVENPEFYGGEPIWNTAEMQHMISASFFWVGSEAPIGGIQPSYWKPYDGSIKFEDRVDTVIHWLKLPLEKRPRLVLLYFQQPDAVGHDFGPESKETAGVMEYLDSILGDLRRKIKQLPYGDKVNLIVSSDHGMASISPNRYVNIFEHLNHTWLKTPVGGNPVYLIDAADGFEDSVIVNLNQVRGITAWRKRDIPSRFQYGNNQRISDVLVLADSSWSVGIKPEYGGNSGAHGYDNSNTDMHTIFYAEGPDFKNGYTQEAFENVDIYPLIAQILGLKPAVTDGSLEHVAGMLMK